MAEYHKVFVAVYMILKKDDQVFLLRRANTGYEDGKYSLPAGHLEEGEQPTDAATREVKEEIGVGITPNDIRCVHVMHRLDDGHTGREYDDFFFICEKWDGEPSNNEPAKCDDARWFLLNELPSNTIPYIAVALGYIQSGRFYSER